jgi:hypothetical protein
MSILKVGSNNPKLSFILSKNPATIRTSLEPFTRDLRKGKLYGWFNKADDSEFKLLFKDSDTEVSFVSFSEWEYLDKTRYSSPYLPIGMVTTALASALKKESEFDTPEFTSYVETVIKVSNPKIASACARHFVNMAKIEMGILSGQMYTIHIEGNSVQTILNVMVVFCLIQAMYDKECYIDMNASAIEFYIRALNRVNAPYFIRYLFNRTVFSDKHTFNTYRESMQLAGTVMNYGDTRRHRFDAVAEILKGGERLVDVGCGELFFSKRLAKKYGMVDAFDADPVVAEDSTGKAKGWGLENVVVTCEEINAGYVDTAAYMLEGADILLTEVIEHMELDQAMSLLRALLKTDYNQIVITVPNKDFNVNYDISEEGSRHSDHKWELGTSKFSEVLTQHGILPDDLRGIGDSVDGIHSSILLHFKKKEVIA